MRAGSLSLFGVALLLASAWARADDASRPPELVPGQPTPTIRLMVWHGVGLGGNEGYLYVTARQVRFEVTYPARHKDDAFTWARSDIVRIEKADFGVVALHIALKSGKRHTLIQMGDLLDDSGNFINPDYLLLALQDFNGALAAAKNPPPPGQGPAAPTSDSSSAPEVASADADQSGVFIDGGKGIFVGKRLAVTYRNDCQAGDPDFPLLQESVTHALFAPGRFLPSANGSPELVLHLALTRLQGIDGATDALDIFGLADQDAKAVATFQLTDARGKVVRSGTVVANVKDDGDNDPYRRDAIHQLANQLASYLTQ